MRIDDRRYRNLTWQAAWLAVLAAVPLLLTGCFGSGAAASNAGETTADGNKSSRRKPGPMLELVTVDEGVRPGGAILSLRAARNEWVDGYVQLPELGGKAALLKVGPLELKPSLDKGPDGTRNANTDGNGRPTLPTGAKLEGFRAYLVASLPFDTRSVAAVRSVGSGAYGAKLPRALVPLKQREPGVFEIPAATRADTSEGLVYLEIMPGVSAEAGNYEGAIELTADDAPPRSVPVQLKVDDLTLSEAPSFLFAGELNWDDLRRVWPKEFAGTTARLMSRRDGKSVLAVERLDEMVRMARENRVVAAIEGLEPTVKNSPREGLRIDWSDYDSLVIPWLRGEVDRSGEGMAGFPLPSAMGNAPGESVAGVDSKTYWQAVTGHFDQERLLGRMLVGQRFPLDRLPEIAQEKVRQVGVRRTDAAITEETYRQVTWTALAGRKLAASAGPSAPGVASPRDIGDAANPGWFYPGEWFGQRQVIPGVALKWARRAQQDYELLDLARRRGASALSVGIAERITRIGQFGAGVGGEPGGDLLAPAVEKTSWDEALRLAREASLARVPGASEPGPDEKRMLATAEDDALNQWAVVLQRPVALPVGITYAKGTDPLRIPFALELALPEQGTELQIQALPKAWDDTTVQLRAGGATLQGTFALDKLKVPYRDLLQLEVSSGPDRLKTERKLIIPAVHALASAREPDLDGQLGDWAEQDVIARKELEPEFAPRSGFIQMLDRRSAQRSVLVRSPKDTQVFARWRADALYLALRFDGIDDSRRNAITNFTNEVAGRASGEDLCRIALKGVGFPKDRELRLLAKPAGLTVEQGEALSKERVRYAASTRDGTWRAEIRIPASLLTVEFTDGAALELQIIRHDAATGESSSWAGPVDRDYEGLRGLLLLANTLPKEKAK